MRMGKKFDEAHEHMQDEWAGTLTAPERRKLMVKWASEVWDEVCEPDRCLSLVNRSFVRTGCLVAKNGTENGLIDLDGWMRAPGGYNF
jgi:hypothetical protein